LLLLFHKPNKKPIRISERDEQAEKFMVDPEARGAAFVFQLTRAG